MASLLREGVRSQPEGPGQCTSLKTLISSPLRIALPGLVPQQLTGSGVWLAPLLLIAISKATVDRFGSHRVPLCKVRA